MQINPYGKEITCPPPPGHDSFDPTVLTKGRKHFLKFYLDIGYYLCVFPYRFRNTLDGSYFAERWLLQQMLCGTVHSLAFLDTITNIRSLDFESISTSPKLYFVVFTSFLHTCTVSVFAYSVWKNAVKYGVLVQSVQKCPIISLWFPKRVNLIVSLLTVLYVGLALANPAFKEGGNSNTWQELYEFHASRGRFILFLDSKHIQNQTFTGGVTPANSACAVLSYLVNSSEWIVVYHVDLLMIIMSLSLRTATSFFIDMLKQDKDCKNAIRNYEALKTLSNRINCTIGIVTLTYTVDSILFYATQMEVIFTGKNWFHKVVVLQFFLSSISWLHFASNACLQMDQFREWIRKKDNRYLIPSKSISVMLLLDEVATDPVGLSGNGLFTVNYNFVAQAITTLMTYFIIVIQFK